MDDSEPLYGAAALGFRVWRAADDGTLCSTGLGRIAWRAGRNVAYCPRHADAPEAGCTCGLYAFHGRDRAVNAAREFLRERGVIGALAARGRLEIHRDGFRAQEAAIIALAVPSAWPLARWSLAQAAAARYGVPLVEVEQLQAVGARYAEPVPGSRW